MYSFGIFKYNIFNFPVCLLIDLKDYTQMTSKLGNLTRLRTHEKGPVPKCPGDILEWERKGDLLIEEQVSVSEPARRAP
jgi:hypothetical protein